MSCVLSFSLNQAETPRISDVGAVNKESPIRRLSWAEACRQELEWFVVQHRNAGVVVLSVLDGTEVAATAPNPLARTRFTAMSALLVSLGRTMLHATAQSSIRHQVVETEDGMALMLPIGDSDCKLLFAVISEKGARPAPLLETARQCCLRIHAAALR